MNIANPEKKEEALNNEIEKIETGNNQIIEIINENIELLNDNTSKIINYAQSLPTGAIAGSDLSLSGNRDITSNIKSHKLNFKKGPHSIFKKSEGYGPIFDNPGTWNDETIANLINTYAQDIFTKVREAFPGKVLTPFDFRNYITIASPTFRQPFFWYVDNLNDFVDLFKNRIYDTFGKKDDEKSTLVLKALKLEGMDDNLKVLIRQIIDLDIDINVKEFVEKIYV